MDDEYQKNFPDGYAEGKKSHQFKYTYNDIAFATGLRFNTVRIYASKGKFDPYNLSSVCEFVTKYKKKV